MPFRLALSGLNAAQADLSVTANNIANTATAGFKGSRAEFAELFSVSPQGVSSTAIGNGVRVSNVSQQFSQGNIDFTDSSLDLALSGQGFFIVSDGGALAYTRAGAFQVDRNGYIVNSQNQRLQAYPPGDHGSFNTGALRDIQLVTNESAPSATTEAEAVLNLPGNAEPPTNATFDPADMNSYNHATSLTTYDSLGAAHTATLYFVKGAANNEWTARLYVDGAAVGGAQPLAYSSTGALIAPANGQINFGTHPTNTGHEHHVRLLALESVRRHVQRQRRDAGRLYDRTLDRHRHRFDRRRSSALHERSLATARPSGGRELREPTGVAAAWRHDVGGDVLVGSSRARPGR
jgi:flagellar hook protein FlgE